MSHILWCTCKLSAWSSPKEASKNLSSILGKNQDRRSHCRPQGSHFGLCLYMWSRCHPRLRLQGSKRLSFRWRYGAGERVHDRLSQLRSGARLCPSLCGLCQVLAESLSTYLPRGVTGASLPASQDRCGDVLRNERMGQRAVCHRTTQATPQTSTSQSSLRGS